MEMITIPAADLRGLKQEIKEARRVIDLLEQRVDALFPFNEAEPARPFELVLPKTK